MSQLIKQEIAGLIEQSDNIAKQVRLENWDHVEDLTHQRQNSLEAFFKKPINTKHIYSIEEMIRSIMKIDHQLVEFIENEKKSTFNKFTKLQNNNRAHKTYQNVATLNIP